MADDNTGMALQRITKEELKTQLDATDEAARPVLVDARLKYPYEHSTMKLPGALRFAPPPAQAPALAKGRAIVVYDSDPDEVTAVSVAAGLLKAGHRVSVLKGGLPEWTGANLPIEAKEAIKPAPPPAKEPAAAAPGTAPAAAPAAAAPAPKS
jgi:rhodanese-related sulfurtransferase